MKTSCIRRKSILVVDDDTRMLRALTKVLRGEGASVTCAEWVGEAVEILAQRKKRFDLVITDLRMPAVTGTSLVYGVHEIFPSLPVIVLTAFGNAEVRAECLKQGAAAFLEKPVDTAQLLAAIESALAPSKAGSKTDATAPSQLQPGNPDEKSKS